MYGDGDGDGDGDGYGDGNLYPDIMGSWQAKIAADAEENSAKLIAELKVLERGNDDGDGDGDVLLFLVL